MPEKGNVKIFAVLMVASVLGAMVMQAQQRRRAFSPERAAERLAERLNLTEEQKSTVQSYFEDQRSQMQVLRNDDALTRQQRMERAREIQRQTRDKVRSILTVEQQQRAEELRNEARQQFQERRQERFDATARLLELTPEQKSQMQSVFEEQRNQLRALRDDSSLIREERREQARAIREETQNSINSILDSAQQQKLEDLRASRGGFGRGGRRGGPGGRRVGIGPNRER